MIPNMILLHFVGKNLDPDKVTKVIGIEPYLDRCQGEPLNPDNPVGRKARVGLWELCIEGRQRPDLLLKNFTDKLRPYRKALAAIRTWKEVNRSRSYVSIVVNPSKNVARCVVGLRAKDVQFWSTLGFDISVSCWMPGLGQARFGPSRKHKAQQKKIR